MLLRWVFLISVLGATWTAASPTVHVPARNAQQLFTSQIPGVPGLVGEAVLQMPSTLKARMLAAIARGELAGAIALWELEMGRRAPQWLTEFQAAFNVVNQRAGPCAEVAKSVFEGFKRLGEKPAYVRFTSTGSVRGANLIAWERRAGEPLSTIQVSENSVHFAVQIKDRLYDAMTGPTGLTVTEYMKRLKSPGDLSMQVVSELR
ncbi:hypothetical protein [Archangium sp.]|uniref:hypothetical protein n=1 Tax=Archangium sp. TaxID=1872627 RepID=UPI002D56C001|nr:hypothetical protein [Archangium sp.]HYO57912.1 hypothetical protein [Archangium sp.]